MDALAVAKNSRWIASGSGDGSIQIRTWPDGASGEVLLGHTARVQALAFAPDSRQLASAGFDGTIRLWSLGRESLPAVHANADFLRADPRFALALSPDWRSFAVPGDGNQVVIYDTASGRPRTRFTAPGPVDGLRFALADSGTVYGVSHLFENERWTGVVPIDSYNTVWKADVAQATCDILRGERSIALVGSPAILRDGRFLWGDHEHSSRLALIDVRERDSLWEVSPKAIPRSFHFCVTDDDRLVAVSLGGAQSHKPETVLIDLESGRQRRLATSGLIAISQQTNQMLTRTAVFDLTDERPVSTLAHHTSGDCGAFSSDGRTLATGDRYGVVRLWNVATGQLLAELQTASVEIVSLRFSERNRKLAAIGLSKSRHERRNVCQLYIWSAGDGL
jgi:WD40 repeat protein